MVNEPEQWTDLGIICSLKGKSENERNGIRQRLRDMLRYDTVKLIRLEEILSEGPF